MTTGTASLEALDLGDRLTRRRSKTLQDLMPEDQTQPQAQTTYAMQVEPIAPLLQAPTQKVVTMAKIWYIHQLYLCRLCNVSGLDALHKIWRTLASPQK